MMTDATPRLTVEEARERDLLPKTTADVKRRKCPECVRLTDELRRKTAFLKLVGKLLVLLNCDLRIERRFHPTRRWRFDLALLDAKVALEIDGYGKGHYGIVGRAQDNEKDAEAQLLGWRVVRVAWKHVENGKALALIERMVEET